jgi:hypothetical protein
MEQRVSVYKVLAGKPGGKKPLRRTRRRREDNIKMDLQEVGWGAWIGLIWLWKGRVSGCCECGNEPSGSIKYGKFLE